MHGDLLFGFYSYKPSTAGCSQDYKLRTDTNIEQHDPSRLVLCACINKYGCVCYRYNDEVENWSCRMMIMAVVFAILPNNPSSSLVLPTRPTLHVHEKVIFLLCKTVW